MWRIGRWCWWSSASAFWGGDPVPLMATQIQMMLAMWGPIGSTFPSNCAPSKDALPNRGG
ncbi:hypothetical protein CFP56_024875 [Quercus suber]|uniref:Uncharacterized protein n=1 Tax=Quercus suber TaxID=58331 RepID=A0AAW0K5X7_QUESU